MRVAQTGATAKSAGHRIMFWVAVAVVVVLVGVSFGLSTLPLADWAGQFSEWVRSQGAAGVLLIGAAYIVGTLLLVPGTALTLAAALAYGWQALPLVFFAATIGAIPPFLIARHLCHNRIGTLISSHRLADAVVHAVNSQSWKIALLLRFSPVVPFNAQNYLLGATTLSLSTYAATTALGILPGTAMRVYVTVAALSLSREVDPAEWAWLGVGLIATVAMVAMIVRAARTKLREAGLAQP